MQAGTRFMTLATRLPVIGLGRFLQKPIGSGARSEKFSYGLRRLSLLSAFISGVVICGGAIFVAIAAFGRIFHPGEPRAGGMLILAVVGIAVNGLAAWRLGHGATHNEKVLSWHLIEDMLGWIAVLYRRGSVSIYSTGAGSMPPRRRHVSIFVSFNVARQLLKTAVLFLQGNPDPQSLRDFRETIGKFPDVIGMHDLHFWSLDGAHHVLSMHVVTSLPLTRSSDLKNRIRQGKPSPWRMPSHDRSRVAARALPRQLRRPINRWAQTLMPSRVTSFSSTGSSSRRLGVLLALTLGALVHSQSSPGPQASTDAARIGRAFSERPVWIHASSGEFEYAKPFITELKLRSPGVRQLSLPILRRASLVRLRNFPGVDFSLPLPIDLPGPIRSFLIKLNPRAGFIARTDLWPELLHQAKARGIPLILFSVTKTRTPGSNT